MKHIIAILLFAGAINTTHAQTTSTIHLEQNNVDALVTNGGTFFTDVAQGSSGYEFPIGSNDHLIFASSIWFGAEDLLGTIHLSGQAYDFQQDLYPGTLSTATGTPVPATTLDQIYTVTSAEIDFHIANFSQPGYTAPSSILDWPAHGDVALDEDFYMAPFTDVDGDGIYNPSAGDSPKIRGNRAVYFIMNDVGIHNQSGADYVGVECHFMFYQFESSDYLNNTTFLNLKVINRSSNTYPDFRLGCFLDADLGDSSDDMFGCDSSKNVMYTYNGSNNDADYQTNPPAIGVVSLGHDLYSSMNFSSLNAATDMPTTATDYWMNMTGYYHDGTHITVGGTGYGGTTQTNFQYHGNPNNSGEWSEINEGNLGGDRRSFMSVVDEPLTVGGEVCYDFAFIVGTGGNHLENVNNLLNVADQAQSFFDSQTGFVCEKYELTLSNNTLDQLEFEVYPIPSNGQFAIDITGEYDLQIFDMTGKLVYSNLGLNDKQVLDLDLLPSNYILQIRQNEYLVSKRITII